MNPRYDVAIHAPRAWPLYADPPQPSPGGTEVQMRYLATTLAELGLRVCHIILDHPSVPAQRDGVDLIRAWAPDEHPSKLQLVRRVLASLASADAATYVQGNAGPATGMVGLFTRFKRRRFVYLTVSDGDLTFEAPIGGRLARASYRMGMHLADTVVVQTEEQLRRAQNIIGGPLQLIRSFADGVGDAGRDRTAFLWIGRIVDQKDPLAYLDLASRVPEARFWMVADTSGHESERLIDEVRARAGELPNVELLDPIPQRRLFELYDQAVAVVNTSHVEGFPNTFMEGWARGTPALSLRLDPDNVIRSHWLGSFADGSLDDFARAARGMWMSRHDPALSDRAQAYIEREHSPASVGGQWVRLIEELRPPSTAVHE